MLNTKIILYFLCPLKALNYIELNMLNTHNLVYKMHNAQTGDELRTLFYKNNNWQGLTDDETVIAWKEKDLKKIVNEYKWLKDHILEIQKLFKLNKVDINDFVIAETLEECICKYGSWFHWKQVHFIDDIYVIKVLF